MEPHEKNPKKKISLANVLSDMVKSGIIGGINVTTVTPILNFTNRLNVIANNKTLLEKGRKIPELSGFTFRRAFDGILSYNSCVYPMIGVSIGLQRSLTNNVNLLQNKKQNDLLLSAVSGAAGGFVGTLPEGVAQVQQLSKIKPSTLNVLKDTYKQHGLGKMNCGALAVMSRQSIFTMGYLGLMPMFTELNQEYIISNEYGSSFVAASVSAAIVVPITTPINNLRFHKQYDMHKSAQKRSYNKILKDIVVQRGVHGLFHTWKPRAFTSVISMFMLHEGKKIYDDLTDDIDTENYSSIGVKLK